MDLSVLENQAPSAMKSIPFSADKIDKSFHMALTSEYNYGVIPVIPALMGQIIKKLEVYENVRNKPEICRFIQ